MNNGIIKRMFVLLAIAVTGITQDIEAQRVAAKSPDLALPRKDADPSASVLAGSTGSHTAN